LGKTKLYLRIFLIDCIFVFLSIFCPVVSGGQAETVGHFPGWIKEEKVRAGYLYNYNDTKYASVIRNHGFNTLIVKGWKFHDPKDYAKTFGRYQRWGKAGKEHKLHVFIAYNWQPEKEVFSYRRVVFSDGASGVTVCPRDDKHWRNHVIRLGKDIAKLSLNPSVWIDGIFFDNEWYRSEGLPAKNRNYGRNSCFCDDCFSSFLFTKGYTGTTLPPIGPEERQKWLIKNNLISEYFKFLKKEVERYAFLYEQELHKINPSLILGMYPTPFNWALRAIAHGFGTEAAPVMLFATDSYYKGGHEKIPKEPVKLYEKSGIHALYLAGFLFGKYGSNELGINLHNAAKKCDGYWLWKMTQLWQPQTGKIKLAAGSQAEYWQMISDVNKLIDKYVDKTDIPQIPQN